MWKGMYARYRGQRVNTLHIHIHTHTIIILQPSQTHTPHPTLQTHYTKYLSDSQEGVLNVEGDQRGGKFGEVLLEETGDNVRISNGAPVWLCPRVHHTH
jgi:hypothetical protein